MKAIDKIKEYLSKKGISHIWLADKLDMTKTHFSLVINGKRNLTEKNLKIIQVLFPDVDFSDDPEDKEKAKNLFKD